MAKSSQPPPWPAEWPPKGDGGGMAHVPSQGNTTPSPAPTPTGRGRPGKPFPKFP
jgi:hypothetical protein